MRATGVMLFSLSKHYFTSRNCLREVKASLDAQRPLVLVHEQQEEKGGGPLEVLKAECRDDEMRTTIVNGSTPITWHRISHYQNLTLKLIATDMLRHSRRHSGIGEWRLVLPGEVNVSRITISVRREPMSARTVSKLLAYPVHPCASSYSLT